MQNLADFTLCGSVRFKNIFDWLNEELTIRGCVVISLGMWGTGVHGYIADNDPRKRILEKVHFKKIDLSRAIFVIDTNGKENHIGKSTRREISYAQQNAKQIYLLSYYMKGEKFKWNEFNFEFGNFKTAKQEWRCEKCVHLVDAGMPDCDRDDCECDCWMFYKNAVYEEDWTQ
jgi:hypothetical protein